MPRPIHHLNAQQCKHPSRSKLADGGGLYLVTTPAGSSRWEFRYTLNGQGRYMGLGGCPAVSLSKARSEAEKGRKHLAAGRDPIEAKKRPHRRTKATFTSAAAEFIRAKRYGWSNCKHTHQWVSTLKQFARPIIGDREVDTIEVDDVLRVLKPIWLKTPETAKRVQGRLENIFDFAIVRGYRKSDNPARGRGHLDKVLLPRAKVRAIRHHPALAYADMPAFWSELESLGGVSVTALRFTILTACRTSEVLNATWDEIDGKVWTIPAERMKARHEHRVPLSKAASAVLRSVPRIEPYIFAGRFHNRPISNMTMLKVLQQHMGRSDLTVHGFRSSFRDWAEETTGFPARVCEAALAHTVGDKNVAAYQRGDLFEKRIKLMGAWAAHCTVAVGGNVTPLRRQKG